MPLASLAEVIAGLLLLVGVGVLLRATHLLSAEDARPINAVIVYAGLPALVFRAVQPARLTPELAVIAGVAWAVAGASFVLAWLLARWLRLARPAAAGLMLAAALGNTGYIGYPVTRTLLGESGLVRAVFYDVFGTVIALLTIGFLVASSHGTAEEQARPVREMLRFPALVAVVLALVLHPFGVPILVSRGLESLANMTVPLIMISVGITLRPAAVGENLRAVLAASAVKLVAAPALALLVARVLFAGDLEAQRVVVLEAGMPSMMLGLVVGLRFGLDSELIAAAILVTTALSALTVPMWQLVLR